VRFQRGEGDCAPVSLYNALLSMGQEVSLAKIRRDCGTNPREGASEHGLKQAIERAERTWTELSAGWDDAYVKLHAHLRDVGAAVILTEGGDHWEAAVGVCGPRIIVFNSDRTLNPYNRSINGVNVLSKRQLQNYWDTYEGQRHALLIG
jgi:hypothetical protein